MAAARLSMRCGGTARPRGEMPKGRAIRRLAGWPPDGQRSKGYPGRVAVTRRPVAGARGGPGGAVAAAVPLEPEVWSVIIGGSVVAMDRNSLLLSATRADAPWSKGAFGAALNNLIE